MTSSDARDLAGRIARHLTGPARWSAVSDRDGDGATLREGATLTRDADGAAIHVRIGGWRNEGRVTFCARWPRFHDGRQYAPRDYLSITCKASRDCSPRTIPRTEPPSSMSARATRRRALPSASRNGWREQSAPSCRAPEGYRQERNADAVELLGGRRNLYRLKVSAAYCDRPLRVSFEVSDVDEETALRILALLPAGSQEGAR